MPTSCNRLAHNKAKSFYQWGGYIIAELTLILLAFHFNLPPIVILTIALSLLLLFFFVEPKSLFVFSILSLIFSEFCWFEVVNGYLKPFHLLAVVLFVSFTVFHIRSLLYSKTVKLIIVFITLNLISILCSANRIDSLRSFILPLILIAIGLNIAVILYNNKISTSLLQNMILYGALVAVFFGFAQMFVYSVFGFGLNLTEVQYHQIISAKRPPSFFTEADTFGKFLSLPFFLFLPFALRPHYHASKNHVVVIIILLFAVLLNMTRSAMIGIGITLILYTVYCLKHGYFKRTLAVFTGTIAIILICIPIVLAVSRGVGAHTEFSYRMKTLIDPSLLSSDAQFRRIAIEETLKGSFVSPLIFFLGHGWGQSYIVIWEQPRDVGGSLFVNILYYGGFFALIIFAVLCYRIIIILYKSAMIKNSKHFLAEGLLFCFISMLIISQLASMWIAPEFWLVIGCAIYFELRLRKERKEGLLSKA